MKSARLGCISGTGLIATIVTLLVLGGAAFARGGVLFNPGPLNNQKGNEALGGVFSHAETKGRCSACHSAAWGNSTMADRCLNCHQNLMENGEGFHSVMLAQSQTWSCRDCHTDHMGEEASLTILDTGRFPHNSTGFSLAGHQQTASGRAFTCSDCHGERIEAMDTGMCVFCHAGIDNNFTASHLAVFGGECLACHDGLDTYGKGFDHNQQAFPLSGKHAVTPCGECHSGGGDIQALRSTPQDCYACHSENDPHQGRLGQSCDVCHTTDGWEGAAFDHSLAAFQLSGAHLDVDCEACHINGVFRGTAQECYACHAMNDAHAGRFGQDCAQCHTSNGWEGAAFDHSLAAFQLSGAHLNVACSECHPGGVFQGTPKECSVCHAEPAYHEGLFKSDCAACHDSTAWRPARFDGAHGFPFNHGESGMNACQVCHPDSLSSYTCYSCHEHSPTEIERKHREEGISNFQDCSRCHPTGLREEGEGERGKGGDD